MHVHFAPLRHSAPALRSGTPLLHSAPALRSHSAPALRSRPSLSFTSLRLARRLSSLFMLRWATPMPPFMWIATHCTHGNQQENGGERGLSVIQTLRRCQGTVKPKVPKCRWLLLPCVSVTYIHVLVDVHPLDRRMLMQCHADGKASSLELRVTSRSVSDASEFAIASACPRRRRTE